MAEIFKFGESQSNWNLIDQEQLAAQVVAVMGAHFRRPNIDEQFRILELARQQVEATR